jgi:uncharacterized membrane protein YfcA
VTSAAAAGALAPTAGSLVALALAGVAAGAVQSTLGFGASFLLVPALALVAPDLLPGAVVVAIVPLSVVMVVVQRRGLDVAAVGRITLGRLPGIAAGGAVVAVLDGRALTVAIGVLLLAAVGVTAAGWHVPVRSSTELAAGALSGFTGTAAAVGGPPLALLYHGEAGARLRPTLAGVWLVGSVPVLGALALAGSLTRSQVVTGAALGVATVLGLVAAAPAVPRLGDGRLRVAVLTLAGFGAIVTIVRGLPWVS